MWGFFVWAITLINGNFKDVRLIATLLPKCSGRIAGEGNMDTERIYLYPSHDFWLFWKAQKGVRTFMLFSDILWCLKADTKEKG